MTQQTSRARHATGKADDTLALSLLWLPWVSLMSCFSVEMTEASTEPNASLGRCVDCCSLLPHLPKAASQEPGSGGRMVDTPGRALSSFEEMLSHAVQWLLKALSKKPCKNPAAGLGSIYSLFLEN